eukprot:gene158-211_t
MKKLSLHELNRHSVQAFQQINKLPIVLVLDNIRSMHNVGAAFRIADAFLIEKIYLCGITAHPPHREIHKTALGAEESVAWEYVPHTLHALQKLKQQGYLNIAIEQTQPSTLLHQYQTTPGQKYTLVFGNEVFGIHDEVLTACDRSLEIPQYGTKHSLNVSVSMGIEAYRLITGAVLGLLVRDKDKQMVQETVNKQIDRLQKKYDELSKEGKALVKEGVDKVKEMRKEYLS